MNKPLSLLIIDDSVDDMSFILRVFDKGNIEIIYERVDNAKALTAALNKKTWDLVISDYNMPSFGGMEALEIVRKFDSEIPFFLVSGDVGEDRAVEAMRSGAKDYIMKDNLSRLLPAVTRELKEAVVRKETMQRELELKERLNRMKRFFTPLVAELISSGKVEDPFKWHRKDVTVMFVDLRGFTELAEISEPEDVMAILQEYYTEIAKMVKFYKASIGHVAGDGIMVYFNDPVEIENPSLKAVEMALSSKVILQQLCDKWARTEHNLGFGAGIASGYATIGGIGAEGCWDYSIVGTVANLASRLCGEAKNGQILVSKRFLGQIDNAVVVAALGAIPMKGIHSSIEVYNILGFKESEGQSFDEEATLKTEIA